MTIARLRDLSKSGVITDIDPFNLPPTAFSMAVNARFQGASIVRAPVFRRVPITLGQTSPRFLTSYFPAGGFDAFYLGYLNGRVTQVLGTTETDYSIFGYSNNSSETPFTSTTLQQVLYVNRADRDPWYLTPSLTQFADLGVATPTWLGGTTYSIGQLVLGSDGHVYSSLSNGNIGHDPTTDGGVHWQQTGMPWNTTHRCALIRQCGGALVALNVTKGATNFPTMVKTSSFTQINAIPADWDVGRPSSNATENTLGDFKGPILDAANLGDALIIYGLTTTWSMQADGSTAIFAYHKLFDDRGVINANCVVEVDRKHYVFGPDDIWVHDGISKVSIADLKVKKFIFNNLNATKTERCFVIHDPQRKELRFNFPSGDGFTAFPFVDGCNRCAVFNLVEQSWTFDDLPYIYGAAIANLSNTTLTYATVVATYATIGGSYADQDGTSGKTLAMFGDVNVAANVLESLYAIDEQGPGSSISYPVDTNATRPVTLIRDGIDLDELPEFEDLRGYKIISSIYPQARFEAGAQPLTFTFGVSDYFNSPAVLGIPQTYDGLTQVRCDFNEGGRFLYLEVQHLDYHYFNFTGVDLDVYETGRV